LRDECVTKRLKKHLENHEVFTVSELRLGRVKNGNLMTYCSEKNFDILLTIDKNILFQENLTKYPITIEVFNCPSSKIEDILSYLPSFNSHVDNFEKHQAYIIEKGV